MRQPNRKELKTLVRAQDLNHEALRMVGKIKELREPEEGIFRDSILVNYKQMRLAMERIGLLLEVRLHSKDRDFGEYIFQRVERDLDILEYQIGILDTLVDLWQLQEF